MYFNSPSPRSTALIRSQEKEVYVNGWHCAQPKLLVAGYEDARTIVVLG